MQNLFEIDQCRGHGEEIEDWPLRPKKKKKKKNKKTNSLKKKRRDLYDVDDDRQRTTFNQESFFGTSVKSVEPIRAKTLLNYK